MIAIRAMGIHNSIPDHHQPDLAAKLRALSGKVYRRTDHFIQLAIIGAHMAAAGQELSPQTATYMTSGQGNISVFERICDQRHVRNQLPRPIDFINLLSNSAGFYVASHLGLSGKNLFLSHHRFPVQMALLVARNDLILGREQAALIGGIDEWIPRQELARKILGRDQTTVLGEGSNWMLLGKLDEEAAVTLEVTPRILDKQQLRQQLASIEPGASLAFGKRFAAAEREEIMNLKRGWRRYAYEGFCGYYETLPLFALNRFLLQEKGKLLHIDVSDGRYMIMQVSNQG
ncbi:MAG: hypothetical protein K0A99_04910 [Desulfoarculaceae bacterium]|nr:hypothetical protein [Desulfoarculaceae bacterium]